MLKIIPGQYFTETCEVLLSPGQQFCWFRVAHSCQRNHGDPYRGKLSLQQSNAETGQGYWFWLLSGGSKQRPKKKKKGSGYILNFLKITDSFVTWEPSTK